MESLSCPECDFTFGSYNYLKQHTTEEEARLIEGDVYALNERLKPAEMTLNWQCEDIIDYLEDIQVLLDESSFFPLTQWGYTVLS